MKRVLFVSLWILTAAMVCSAQTTFYFPHIANGVLGGTIWKTTVLLTNPAASGAASGTITFNQDNPTCRPGWFALQCQFHGRGRHAHDGDHHVFHCRRPDEEIRFDGDGWVLSRLWHGLYECWNGVGDSHLLGVRLRRPIDCRSRSASGRSSPQTGHIRRHDRRIQHCRRVCEPWDIRC